MSISIQSRGLAEVRAIGVRGIPGIGFSRLQFILEWRLQGLPSPPAFLEHLQVQVSAGIPGGPARPLGKATAQNSWFTGVYEHGRTEALALELDLTGAALEALERLRGGGPLHFVLDLSLRVRRGERQEPGSDRLQLLVNLSDWAQVLRDVGYLDLLVLAVELPLEVPEEIRLALEETRTAYTDLIAARYDATVMRCRRAMESLGRLPTAGTDPERVWERFAKDRATMTKPERAEVVRLAVRHYSHLAAHMDETGAPETFSRQDALFILAAAAGVIWESVTQVRFATPAAPSSGPG